MNNYKLNEIATSMIAFSTFLGVLFAGSYYFSQIKQVGFLEGFLFMSKIENHIF